MESKPMVLSTVISLLIVVAGFTTQLDAATTIRHQEETFSETDRKADRDAQQQPTKEEIKDTKELPHAMLVSENSQGEAHEEQQGSSVHHSEKKHVPWEWHDAQKKLITSSVKKSCVNFMSGGEWGPADILINGVAGIIEYTAGIAWENRHAIVDYYLLFNG